MGCATSASDVGCLRCVCVTESKGGGEAEKQERPKFWQLQSLINTFTIILQKYKRSSIICKAATLQLAVKLSVMEAAYEN